MSESVSYFVMLFKAVSYALKAEKILKAEKLPHKLIPVPKEISSDCGICLRCEPSFQEVIQAALAGKVEFEEIRQMVN
jgi:bacterioferritin-associated ferredoxin